MNKAPRLPNKRLLGKFVMWRCLFVSSTMIIAIIGVFEWNKTWPKAYTTQQRRAEAFTLLIFGNVWAYASVAVVTALQILVLYVPGLSNRVFNVSGLDGYQWARVLVISVVFFLLVEFMKVTIDVLIFKTFKRVLKEKGWLRTPELANRQPADAKVYSSMRNVEVVVPPGGEEEEAQPAEEKKAAGSSS